MGVLKRVDDNQLQYEGLKDTAYEIYLNDEIIAKGIETIQFKDPKSFSHPIYEVHKDNEIEYVREQAMKYTGVVNFRDLGGYYSEDGRQVRHEMFYRCAAFVKLNEQQKECINSLKIKKLYDFRSSLEIQGNEDYVPSHTSYVHASALHELDSMGMNGNFDFATLMKQTDITQLKDFLKKAYEDLPIQNPAYKSLINDMIQNETPIAFHCSAGKDRTGVAAMIILSILGVDKDTIVKDYLLSNELRKEENQRVFESAKKEKSGMEALMLVNAEAIESCFKKINEVYGNFDTYILKEFGIDDTLRKQLKEKYLY